MAVGRIHASIVIPVVRSSVLASAIVTRSLTPSKLSAPPNFPDAVRVAPSIVPTFPRPDASCDRRAGGLVEAPGADEARRRGRDGEGDARPSWASPVAPAVVAVMVTVAV